MKRILLLLFFAGISATAQENTYKVKFEHFAESRGDYEHETLLEIPYTNVVVMEDSLNSSSGFGLRMNFHGHIVAVDYMETMPDGSIQVILRREDGRNFYGYKPTIKAVLINKRP